MHPLNSTDETLLVRTIIAADDVFMDHLQTPHDEEESSGEEEAVAAAPAAKKQQAANPYHPGCCGTLLFSSL